MRIGGISARPGIHQAATPRRGWSTVQRLQSTTCDAPQPRGEVGGRVTQCIATSRCCLRCPSASKFGTNVGERSTVLLLRVHYTTLLAEQKRKSLEKKTNGSQDNGGRTKRRCCWMTGSSGLSIPMYTTLHSKTRTFPSPTRPAPGPLGYSFSTRRIPSSTPYAACPYVVTTLMLGSKIGDADDPWHTPNTTT